MIRPFTSPMNAPNTIMKANTGSAFASSCPMRLPAITTCAVTTEPIDRSNSPPTMTKYWPIAAIAIGATRCTNRMNCDGSANDGFSSVIATSSTMSSRNTAPRGLTRVRPMSARRRPRLGRSDVTAVMPTPPVRARHPASSCPGPPT